MARLALSAAAALVLATHGAAACIPTQHDPTTPLERIASAANVFVGILSPSETRPDALSVEVIESFKGDAAGVLDYGPTFTSCGMVGPESHGPYIFYERGSARVFTPMMPPALAERFETVDGAIAAAEAYVSVIAKSSGALAVTAMATQGEAGSMTYVLSGPPELMERVEMSLAASVDGCLDAAVPVRPGFYVDLDGGVWIDWGRNHADGGPAQGCRTPLVHEYAKSRTYTVKAGLFKPGQTDIRSIAPEDWQWLGAVAIAVD